MARYANKPLLGRLSGRCPICGRKVSQGAGRCGNCMMRRGAKGSIALMLMGVCGAYYWTFLHPHTHYGFLAAEPAARAAGVVARVLPADFDGWAYSKTTDTILHDDTVHATLLGRGPDPHSGPHSASLELSSSEKYGKHVTIMFPQVQEACGANECQVSLAWDDAPPAAYRFDPPMVSPGGANTVLQTDEYDRFESALGKAHKLKVVASLGMPDDYVVTFPVAGFSASKMR